jgi:antitoxin (DNA-binding transcriptional repressor) of toxin-antitoxin stability system
MKTATVRDLRNHFADVAKWIEHGEQVTITRKGAHFATLAPAQTPSPSKPDQAVFLRRYRDWTPVGRQVSAAETDSLWSSLRD